MSSSSIDGAEAGRGAAQRRVALALAAAVLCGALGPAARAEQSVVLLVLTATDADGRTREQRLRTELALTLDEFEVRVVESGDAGFGGLALADKLALIQLWVDRHGAVATTWIEAAPSGQVLLHLVALATGRALVRIVEAERGPDTEAELALAARELLGEAYLFGPAPGDAAVERVVAAAQRRVVLDPPEEPALATAPAAAAPREDPRWGVLPAFRLGGGLYGHRGPHLEPGGGLAVELRIGHGGFARLALAVAGGPRGRVPDGLVTGLAVSPGIGIGYAWRLGRLALGPVVELAVPWTRVELALGSGAPQQFAWWNLRAALGVEARLALVDDLALLVGWNAGARARQEEFARLSDGRTVLETPIVDWCAVVGLALAVGGG